MSEWVSVKDRMPEFRKQVLGWNKEYGCFVVVLNEHERDDNGHPCWDASNLHTGVGNPEPYTLEYEDEYPTHWMPLPQEPKREE